MIIGCNLDVIPEPIRPLVVGLHNQNVELREEVRRLRRELYAANSERHFGEAVEPNGSMFNEAEELLGGELAAGNPPDENTSPTKPKRKRSPESGGRNPLPEQLPRTRVAVDVPAEQKICPHDGAELVRVGERVVETLAVKPTEFCVIQHVYPACGCPTCKEHMAQAPALPTALPEAACDPSLIAYILEQKFNWGMPLYRIEQQFNQLKVDVSCTRMASWVINAADALGDVAFEIKEFILSQPVIHADETTVQVLKGTGKNPTSKSYMWSMCTPRGATPAVWFEYSPSRDRASAASLLRKFKGHLHLDGYEGYSETVAKNGITRVGCWAHVRRRFDTAKKDGAAAGKPLSAQFLDNIQALFLLERGWAIFSPEERRQQREGRSKSLVDAIHKGLDEERHKVTPKSRLGEAMTYLASQWETLVVFLTDGRVALSNNQMGNHIRPFTVGRKNWLFSDTAAGAEASALLYTLVGTARANGVAVSANLEWILRELFKTEARHREGKLDLAPFLPWNYKARFAQG